ncbi:PEP-CTERM sorting domain-containing protein [Caldimonas brevitalea]|uniref:Autotransporter beta-domain protein n=1 Tax=Caldimonas brevitalea TaxID=413882 RepID=A0A0G3BWQ7_9BURK|nr:PEP-CTERM sorting domain-containing protein [Caldimonas brevitalea]AKJ30980.1 autotransporter beta-domain protein [Caldimonas brevitalea]
MKATFTPSRLARTLVVAAAAITVAPATWAAVQHHYHVTDLGNVSGASLNDAGQVVGTRERAGGGVTSFVWDAKAGFLDIGSSTGLSVVATDISSNGTVVGHSYGNGQSASPFVWNRQKGLQKINLPASALYGEAVSINDHGTVLLKVRFSNADSIYTWSAGSGLKPLLQGAPDGVGFFPTAINNNGAVTGYNGSTTPPNPFVVSGQGRKTDFGTPGGTWAGPAGINGNGWVVGTGAIAGGEEICDEWGSCWIEENRHAFVWNAETGFIDLDAGKKGVDSFGSAINDKGQVVGLTIGEGAFVWQSGKKTFLNSVLIEDGYVVTDPRAINNQGQILAFSQDGRTVLLSPAPEPETIALFVVGLGALAWRARRRQLRAAQA